MFKTAEIATFSFKKSNLIQKSIWNSWINLELSPLVISDYFLIFNAFALMFIFYSFQLDPLHAAYEAVKDRKLEGKTCLQQAAKVGCPVNLYSLLTNSIGDCAIGLCNS